MEKISYLIAVAVGALLWNITQNFIIAVVVALLVEGLTVFLMVVATNKRKQADEQLATWQAGASPIPPLRKVWWRILLLVVVGLPTVILTIGWTIGIVSTTLGGNLEKYGSDFIIPGLAAICLLIVFLVALSSMLKALKWNKSLRRQS